MTHNKRELFEEINETCTSMAAPCKGYDEKQALDDLAKALVQLNDETLSYANCSPVLYYLTSRKGLSPEVSGIQAPVIYQSINWIKSKVFYSFDEELEGEITRSDLSLTSKVPATLLRRCPFSSFFVQTRGGVVNSEYEEKIHAHPDIVGNGFGFFATILPNYDLDKAKAKFKENGELILRVVACADNEESSITFANVSMIIPKADSMATIDECVILSDYKDAYDTTEKIEYRHKYDKAILLYALQYIFHLCSENSVIVPRKTKKAPSWASRKKRAAQSVNVYDVSVPSERSFPADYYGGSSHSGHSTGKTVAPHTRRAHWALRWVGSKEERHLEFRWIRETRIHAEQTANGAIVNVE